MDSIQAQFIGAPCGSHGPYTFYKAFRFVDNEKVNILSLGDFFFLKILDDFPVCIGEIQLLWEEKGANQLLASVRLYFQPRDTPGGPIDECLFGDDELLAMSEKLIVTLEDLVARLMPPTTPWNYGRPYKCYDDLPNDDDIITDGSAELCKAFESNNLMRINFDDVEKEKKEFVENGNLLAPVVIMTYPKYCRYRAVLKRIETVSEAWLKNVLVMAIGGLTSMQRGMRVMFCREVFEYRDLEDLDFHLEHLAPNLKGRPRKRKLKRDDSDSNGYGSDQSSNASSTTPKIKSQRIQNRNGINPTPKSNMSDEERVFLKNLYKFMATRNSPIDRLPSLGFKQIDLYAFYKAAKRLGGYNKICDNRQWKVLYDQLGGHASNTSAATCTRKHYERLILPYELHLRGLRRARSRQVSEQALPPPPVKDVAQSAQRVHNGQVRNRSSRKTSEAAPEADETKPKANNNNICSNAQEKVVKAVKVEKTEEGKAEDAETPLPREEDHTHTSTFTSTGTETHSLAGSSQAADPLPSPKVYKVEDLYHVEMRPAFVQRVPPLEVPVVRHRMATSIMSPIMQRKHVALPHQAESPQHSAALPSASSSMLKLPALPAHSASHQPSSASFKNHHHHHHKPQQHSHQGGSSRQHHPHHSNHQSGTSSRHKTSLSSSSMSSSSSPQKVPAAHSRGTDSVAHSLKAASDYWFNYGLANQAFHPHTTDPHVLASSPCAQPLQAPPPAHSNYVKAAMPPDNLPNHHLHHSGLRQQRTHAEMRSKPDVHFPHPEQVLSRIHTQQQHNSYPATPEAKRPKLNSAATPSTSSFSASSSCSSTKESVLDLSAPYPVRRAPSCRDGSSHSRKAHSSAHSSASVSKASATVQPSSGGGGGHGGGAGASYGVAGTSQSEASVRKMAEALQAQHQQSDVILQSALFGSQFTALPRPAKPAESAPAFMPSLLPHPAFVQAYLGQTFPPTSAASPLGMYQPQLSPTAHAQLLEEIMRQKALQSMTAGSLSPFMMSSLPSTYPPPPTKDSPQN